MQNNQVQKLGIVYSIRLLILEIWYVYILYKTQKNKRLPAKKK